MIYTPSHFNAAQETGLIRELIVANNFATLITRNNGDADISHLPFMYNEAADGAPAILTAHLARANPQAKQLAAGCSALVIFTGPHAYISPRWYEPAPDNVPTWNYAVVHAHGTARPVTDEEQAYGSMQQLVRSHDPDWPLTLPDKERKALLRGILVFQIVVERLDAKFKMSQHRPLAERRNVAAELEKGSAGDQATARWMRLSQGFIPDGG